MRTWAGGRSTAGGPSRAAVAAQCARAWASSTLLEDRSGSYGSLLVDMRVADWLVLRPRETGCIEGGRGCRREVNDLCASSLGENGRGGPEFECLQKGRHKQMQSHAQGSRGERGGREGQARLGEFAGDKLGDVEGRVGSYKCGWRRVSKNEPGPVRGTGFRASVHVKASMYVCTTRQRVRLPGTVRGLDGTCNSGGAGGFLLYLAACLDRGSRLFLLLQGGQGGRYPGAGAEVTHVAAAE